MSEFINEFGKENFIVILVVVIVILIALAILLIIEKRGANKRRALIQNQINNYEKKKEEENRVTLKMPYSKRTEAVEKLGELERYNRPTRPEPEELERYNRPTRPEPEELERYSKPTRLEQEEEPVEVLENEYEEERPEIVYVKEENPEEKAKEKLEEVTKKLVTESSPIEHTEFEVQQEEKSIISYEELLKASQDIDLKNDMLLEDEGEAAITIEELYKKHVEEEDKENLKPAVSNPIFEEAEDKKFKNSEVLSPVFGIYSGKVKQEDNKEMLKEMNQSIEMKDLESEIEKTQDFLDELRRLKDKLD